MRFFGLFPVLFGLLVCGCATAKAGVLPAHEEGPRSDFPKPLAFLSPIQLPDGELSIVSRGEGNFAEVMMSADGSRFSCAIVETKECGGMFQPSMACIERRFCYPSRAMEKCQ